MYLSSESYIPFEQKLYTYCANVLSAWARCMAPFVPFGYLLFASMAKVAWLLMRINN